MLDQALDRKKRGGGERIFIGRDTNLEFEGKRSRRLFIAIALSSRVIAES